jgi:hypothetical protein
MEFIPRQRISGWDGSCPVTTAQSKTTRRLPQSDIGLLTEKQVLSVKPAPRLEHVGNEHSKRVQYRKHRRK